MKKAAIIKISLGICLTAMVTACATGTGTGSGGDMSLQSQYERTIPVCVGADECQAKMNAALAWVANTTGYEIVENSATRIVAGSRDIAAAPSVTIEQAPIGGNRHWILIEINCGEAAVGTRFGARTCAPYWESAIDFNVAVSSAN